MKIAVCVSGETRNYNQELQTKNHRGPTEFVEELRKFPEFFDTVDIFGHTWAHCERPVNYGEFKEFKQQDQSIIDDWVKGDFRNRSYTDSGEGNFNSYNVLANMSSDDYINAFLMQSRRIYGQTWGASVCFDMVPLNEYDIVIRYRWDLEHQGDTNHFKNTVVDRILWLCSGDIVDTPSAMSTNNFELHGGYHWPPNPHIEDTFFIFNKLGHEMFCHVDIRHKLERMIDGRHGATQLPSAHSLWREILFPDFSSCEKRFEIGNTNFNMYMHLPNMFFISSDNSWCSPGSGRGVGFNDRNNDNEINDIMGSNFDN